MVLMMKYYREERLQVECVECNRSSKLTNVEQRIQKIGPYVVGPEAKEEIRGCKLFFFFFFTAKPGDGDGSDCIGGELAEYMCNKSILG
jgi:hypothetical protein